MVNHLRMEVPEELLLPVMEVTVVVEEELVQGHLADKLVEAVVVVFREEEEEDNRVMVAVVILAMQQRVLRVTMVMGLPLLAVVAGAQVEMVDQEVVF